MTPAIEVSGLVKIFGDVPVLDGVNLSAPAHQVTCLIGPSGSGKSTLLRCMAMLERQDAGSIQIDGQPLSIAGQHARKGDLRSRIGMVFQQFNLWPHMTALGNVAEALRTVRRQPRRKAEDRAMAELEKVGLAERAHLYPRQLSGGQQQRVAIARALALDPQLMLFDEPTSALDPELTGEVLNVMRRLATSGMSMVVVSHEIGFVASVAGHVAFLDRGKIVVSGSPEEVFAKPRHPRLTQFLETYIDREASQLIA
ncbi:amino acid ABC transporter ATP-binding protein [Acidisoma cellulosilytica]|uniref:Amino acid ABC transporter ATP-binding protein n=1 Tax=Acidisoma cellulosilyticum TaxID=2802395 RepID=A0A963YWZ2_9PROT|nr:amino acid ABC transporter ATP-binding protein [Acidisoma cellulosilyticum]MCB8878668.1 amino acid ABC transporter ATP-binding protein [Acidisoma cellulosilyticum]